MKRHVKPRNDKFPKGLRGDYLGWKQEKRSIVTAFLKNVKGIGDKPFEKIKDKLYI